MFSTDYATILACLSEIKPLEYVKNRNYLDGSVTRLSPFISRGVISTKMVFTFLKSQGYDLEQIEKLVQELAWRDYWQQVWIAKKEGINQPIRHPQADVQNHEISAAIVNGESGIEAIDAAIHGLYETGYLHNHSRMYISAMTCNMSKSHWLLPAKWMYYHLFDGDWASNALSWQWVAGTNSNKKYYANQENINKYCHTSQEGTFLDIPYEAFEHLAIPSALKQTILPQFKTNLPIKGALRIDPTLPTYIYTSYNLDPLWGTAINANRVLLLEPSQFEQYPISDKVLQFIIDLSKNINGIQIYITEFERFKIDYNPVDIHYKEHPLNAHFSGTRHERDWMFKVEGDYRSFFAFWKKCKRELYV
tara:strand:+ start:106524 stop:107612 length:1089 start_codon:yes stop_codon:yes gene_type:complete